MFLIDSAPARVKSLSSRAREMAPVIYDALLRPLSMDEAMWQNVSETIRRVRCVSAGDPVTSDDRRLMHQYAADYMQGRFQEPQGDLRRRQLAGRAKTIVDVERQHYRMTHPWRARKAVTI